MIYGTHSSIFDSDAYGVDTDSPLSIADWFNPSKEDRHKARKYFDEAMDELLTDIAEMNGIPYEIYSKWDTYDWDEFREAFDI